MGLWTEVKNLEPAGWPPALELALDAVPMEWAEGGLASRRGATGSRRFRRDLVGEGFWRQLGPGLRAGDPTAGPSAAKLNRTESGLASRRGAWGKRLRRDLVREGLVRREGAGVEGLGLAGREARSWGLRCLQVSGC